MIDRAMQLFQEGQKFYSNNQYTEALDSFNEALHILRELKHMRGQGATLNGIGSVYHSLGRFEEAQSHYNEALQIARDIGDSKAEWNTLNNIGTVNKSVEQLQTATQLFQEGQGFYDEGRLMKSLDCYQKALQILKEINYMDGAVAAMNAMGLVCKSLGRFHDALRYYNEALPVAMETDDRQGQGAILSNIALVYKSLGQLQDALRYFNEALPILKEVGERQGEGNTLNGIALVYQSAGRFQDALKYYSEALHIFNEIGDMAGKGDTLNSIGLVHESIGKFNEALMYYNEALQTRMDTGDVAGQGTTMNNIGGVYKSIGRFQDALRYYNESLHIFKKRCDTFGQGTTLINIGSVYLFLSQFHDALSCYMEALPIIREAGSRTGEGIILGNIAYLNEKTGDEAAAIDRYKEAIGVLEEIRGELMVEDFKHSIIKDKVSLYEWLIRILEKSGKYEDCLEYVERAKATAFLDMLGDKKVPFRGDAPVNLLEEHDRLSEEIETGMAKVERLSKLRIGFQDKEDIEWIEAHIGDQTNELKEKKASRKKVLEELSGVNAEIASTKSVVIMRPEEIQGLIPENGAILEYFVGSEDTFVLVINREEIKALRLGTRTERLLEEVLTFRRRFRSKDFKEPLQHLYQSLITPAEPSIMDKEFLYIVPHGALHYVPFHALISEKGRFLLEDYEVAYSPSASAISYAREKNTYKKENVFAIADPLGNLPITRTEAKKVSLLYNDHLPLVGQDATKEAVIKESGRFDHILYSTFGEMIVDNPLNSYLLFAGDEKLTVDEIFDMDLKADLVTLSTCESGLAGTEGEKIPRGDDVVGLCRAFIHAGAPSLVASLWRVNDNATSEVIINFHKYLKNGTAKSTALRQAQMDLINRQGVAVRLTDGSVVHVPGRHPYLWAPFVLMGDYM